MCAGVGVFYAGDEDLCLREEVLQVGDERDGAAHAGLYGFNVPGGAHCVEGGLCAVCVDFSGEGHAGVDGGVVCLCAVGCVCLDVFGECAVYVFGVVAGCEAGADACAGYDGEGVGGGCDGGDVHADDGDCRLGPQAGCDGSGACQGYGVEDAGVVAEVCFGVFEFGFGGAVQAFDGYGAGGVVQGGDELCHEGVGVEHGAAEHAGMDGVAADAYFDVAGCDAAQAGGQCGYAGAPVGGVCDDNVVGGQFLTVGFEEGDEGGRACLLFTLDEELHAELEVIAESLVEGCERGKVHEDACFVVCCAAAVESVALTGCDEGVGVPQVEVAGGLHVVVGVEQDGRVAFCGGAGGDDGGHALLFGAVCGGVGGAFDAYVVEACLGCERGDCLGAAVYLGEVVRFPGDGGNGDELGEGLQGCFEVFGDGVAEGAVVGEFSSHVSTLPPP